MRRRAVMLIVCLLLLAAAGTAAAAGGADDPLVSLSYLTDVFWPKLQNLLGAEAEAEISALAEDYGERLDRIRLPEADGWSHADGFSALELSDGGSVTLAPFGRFMLAEGTARLWVTAGDVIDISEGRVCMDGEMLEPGHRYFAAEEAGALIRIYSESALGFADGDYAAENSGSFAVGERFPDVDRHWGRESILRLAEAGLVNGMEEHVFAPDRRVTRAMFVTILGRMFGLSGDFSAPGLFSDVKETDWFAPYVGWAALSGIVQGYEDGTFAPNAEITREQMAVILIRYCEAYDCRLEESEEGEPFADEDSISAWALDAVMRARRCGLLNGRESGGFDPRGTATRAEMCAVIDRLMEKSSAGEEAAESASPVAAGEAEGETAE